MRFSMRDLLLFVAFSCVAMTLTRLPFLAGCALLIVGVVVANLLIPIRIWRDVVYGGIAGIAVACVALGCYLEIGIKGPHTYTDGRLEMVYRTRPYVVHMGAMVGGVVGLTIGKARTRVAA